MVLAIITCLYRSDGHPGRENAMWILPHIKESTDLNTCIFNAPRISEWSDRKSDWSITPIFSQLYDDSQGHFTWSVATVFTKTSKNHKDNHLQDHSMSDTCYARGQATGWNNCFLTMDGPSHTWFSENRSAPSVNGKSPLRWATIIKRGHGFPQISDGYGSDKQLLMLRDL